MDYFLGMDLGTSSLKAVLFDENFQAINTVQVEYDLYQPQNGWSEQNPSDWIKAVDQVFETLHDKNSSELKSLISIGLTGQMHGLVMLDENNQVIRPAILWNDQRTDKEIIEINEKLCADKVIEITANPALTGFTLAKLLWVKNNEDDNYAKCKHILLPKDYIRFYLSGDYATDVSDASGMQVLDVKNRKWSEEVCKAFDIDMAMLPKLHESVEKTGELKSEFIEKYQIAKPVSIAAGAGDNAAAAIGCGVVDDGSTFTTIGTSGVVFTQSDKMRMDDEGRIHTFCSAVPNTWHVMGVTLAAGLSVNWYKDNFYQDFSEKEVYGKIEEDLKASKVGANNLLYLPYLMGERTPHKDPFIRGAFIGLSGIHQRKDTTRAVIEGVTFSLRDCLSIIRSIGLNVDNMYLTGGGASNETWVQILADNFDTSIQKINGEGGTTLGAAILSSIACGKYSDLKEVCHKYISYGDKLVQNKDHVEIYSAYYDVYTKAYDAIKGISRDLLKLS